MLLNFINNTFKFLFDYLFLLKPYTYTNQYSFSDPASSLMVGIIDLHHTILFYLIVVSIIVFWLLVYLICYSSMWSEYSYFNHCPTLEIVWTLIPSMIIASILLPSLSLLHSADELIDPSITVKVIGHQWYWSYEYSDFSSSDLTNNISFDSYIKSNWINLIAEPVLILPVRTTIRFLITSEDVLHSWAIPAWGVKMDAVPGRLNQVIISVFKPGLYYGQCSEICGIGHGFMPITVEVVPVLYFIEWISFMYAFKKEFFHIPNTNSGMLDFVLLNYLIMVSDRYALYNILKEHHFLNSQQTDKYDAFLAALSDLRILLKERGDSIEYKVSTDAEWDVTYHAIVVNLIHTFFPDNQLFEFALLHNVKNLQKASSSEEFIYRCIIELLVIDNFCKENENLEKISF